MATKKCGMKTEIFSRVCGYHRPVKNWNKGKQSEFGDRKVFSTDKAKSDDRHEEPSAKAG